MREGTLLRQFRGGLVIARSQLAVEAVTGTRIRENGKAGILVPHFFDYRLWNVIILEAKVENGRAGEPFVNVILNSAGIVGDGGVGMQARVADPGERTAPAKADDANFAGAMLAKILDGRVDVRERLIERNALDDLHPLPEFLRSVAQLHVALGAVK